MNDNWKKFLASSIECPELGFRLDLSRMNLPEDGVLALTPQFDIAFAEMAELEAGAIANPDEQRQVGHYWLRDRDLAPDPEDAVRIREMLAAVKHFADEIRSARLRPAGAAKFRRFLLIGIGGSALGPQFIDRALGDTKEGLQACFFDNTDPDSFRTILAELEPDLGETLTVVISKSGGTAETRNGMLETQAAYERAGLNFGEHACAVTGEGSRLDSYAVEQKFLARFPMWDWVGGRTSVFSAVGLLPAALQGVDVDAMREGARRMDAATRIADVTKNPAAALAMAWHVTGNGKGERAMVVLPYRDRLALFSRYLQQLVMESIGKRKDRRGRVVHQGIAVYGNKGSTDQHAYVQQLRDGLSDFFVSFIEVIDDGPYSGVEVEPGVRAGDYLHGFLLGTRKALHDSDRPSLTVTFREWNAGSLGALIALYERAVGLYASLVDVNAYDQPGVEAGKKAAAEVLALKARVIEALAVKDRNWTAEDLADSLDEPEQIETVFHLLEHLAVNRTDDVERIEGDTPDKVQYRRRSAEALKSK
jgi:glucose-6-phosphate isomerase